MKKIILALAMGAAALTATVGTASADWHHRWHPHHHDWHHHH